MIHIEIPIKAPVLKVWLTLVEETHEWWSSMHFTSPHTQKMEFQEYVGGKLFEDFGNRQGIVWAEVIGIKAGEFIHLKGHLSPEFGGPNISFGKIELIEKGEHCVFSYKESWMISGDAEFYTKLQEGWHNIFMDLKRYIEN